MRLNHGASTRIMVPEIENMKIEIEREDDGRWIAEVPDLPGVMVYGTTRQDALAKAEALALRVIAEGLGASSVWRGGIPAV